MVNRAKSFKKSSLERVEVAIRVAQKRLLGLFEPSAGRQGSTKSNGSCDTDGGYWVGELEADATLESDYILFLYFLNPEKHRARIRKLANCVRDHQLPDGTWNIYFGGAGQLSASVKAYFALRLADFSPDDAYMVKARNAILHLGGAKEVNSFTKFYLALLGQLDWDDVPAIPPEVVLLPRFFYLNIYEISYWSRAILIPLSILYSKRAAREPPEGNLIRELYVDSHGSRNGGHGNGGDNSTVDSSLTRRDRTSRDGDVTNRNGNGNLAHAKNGSGVNNRNGNGHSLVAGTSDAIAANGNGCLSKNGGEPVNGAPKNGALFSWTNFFLLADRVLKLVEKTPVKPLRRMALKKAEKWMVSRFEDSDGLGAIFPSMVNSVMAMRALGYAENHPLVTEALEKLQELEIEAGDQIRLQPCLSPIWDTAKAVNALHESGVPSDNEQLVQACRWLVSKEVRKPGDWKVRIPHVDTSGWYFQFRNEFYPDVDDTGAVVMALSRAAPEKVEGIEGSIARGLEWVLNMQCSDGGWAAFDVDVQREVLTKVPYADHNAMLDPPCADITGRCLEMFSRFPEVMKESRVQSAVKRGVEYLKRTQDSDGTWYGRWGVNYIYGTWQALKGLVAVGEDPRQPYILRSVGFLKRCQNPDGGWGETCASYEDPTLKGQGPTTPSQSAWALMGLIAAGEVDSPEVERGICYLLDNQGDDGDWEEHYWTGTGFPRVFYLKYHLYSLYFPLFALGMYRNATNGSSPARGSVGDVLRGRLSALPTSPRRGALRAFFGLPS